MRSLVKISNVVAAVSIVLLIYWVFVFIVIQVFGLRVFRENITQTFGLSVLGILAAMAGSLMINVMLNMTRIADRQEGIGVEAVSENASKPRRFSKWGIVLLAIFPLLTVLLFGGDYLTARKKEAFLVDSARSVIEKFPPQVNSMADYRFTEDWLISTSDSLELMRRTDENFPYLTVLVRDTEDGADVVLRISSVSPMGKNDPPHSRKSFVFAGSRDEREYLKGAFEGKIKDHRFSASDGNYELYYPYFHNGRTVVFYFTDNQQYGKLGS